MKYSLAIAHRVCPILAKTAYGFADKFEMVKVTTASLAAAIKGVRTKLFVILDGCNAEYEQLFDATFSGFAEIDYERISTPAIGNHPTYAKQMELLSSVVDDAEFLYLSEDDYIYRNDAFRAMMDFLTNDGVDFVTPLDHPDRYSHLIPESVKVEIRISEFCHWREAGTTCCTFMTKSDTFKEARVPLALYGKGASDIMLWLGITKDSVFSPSATLGAFLRYVTGRRKTECGYEFMTLAAWLYFKWRLFFLRKHHLWGPIPSLAVHLCKPSLPPLWESIYQSGTVYDAWEVDVANKHGARVS